MSKSAFHYYRLDAWNDVPLQEIFHLRNVITKRNNLQTHHVIMTKLLPEILISNYIHCIYFQETKTPSNSNIIGNITEFKGQSWCQFNIETVVIEGKHALNWFLCYDSEITLHIHRALHRSTQCIPRYRLTIPLISFLQIDFPWTCPHYCQTSADHAHCHTLQFIWLLLNVSIQKQEIVMLAFSNTRIFTHIR